MDIEEARDNLIYFYFEKGDLKRMCNYDETKEILKKKYPYLVQALDQLHYQERIVDAFMNQLRDDFGE